MKNVLITGISRGLGLELTRTLLRQEEYVIYGISRCHTGALEELQRQYPNRLHWKSLDVRNIDEVQHRLFGEFIPDNVALYGYVNNAAVLYKALIPRIEADRMCDLFQTNLIAPILITRQVVRNFIFHRTAGHIVHLSSICAHRGFEGLSMIAASKGGIEAFSRSTAREYGRYKIRSNVVVVGLLEGGMGNSVNPQQKTELHALSALKESTEIDSVIQTICFLLSGQAGSITGQNIHVNAGIV